MTANDAFSGVDTPSPAVKKMRDTWDMVEALMGGTAAMRALGERFLPRWPSEEPKSYAARLRTSTLFPAFKRTAHTLAARPFSKAISYSDDVPPRIRALLEEDCDMQGNNLDVFAAVAFRAQMAFGVEGILIDHPVRPLGATTQLDDAQLNMRPYLVHVSAQQIIGYRTEMINGLMRLAQLRISECVEVPDGAFGTKEIKQIRVLEPGKWALYRPADGATAAQTVWTLFDSGTTTLKEIPFVFLYGERTGFMTAKPPLLELAHLNVKHWQQQSDQDNLMHVARVPVLTVRGVHDDFKLVIGASAAVSLGDSPTAEMRFVEHTGAAIGAGKMQLDDLKEEMRQSGAELLVLRPGPATATEVASDNAVGMCALQEMANATEDALDRALQFMAEYMGEPNGGHVELFKDFGAASLSDASAQLLLTMSTAGKLSNDTLIDEFKRRGILSAEVDWETEQEAMGEEGPPAPPAGKIDPITGLPRTQFADSMKAQ